MAFECIIVAETWPRLKRKKDKVKVRNWVLPQTKPREKEGLRKQKQSKGDVYSCNILLRHQLRWRHAQTLFSSVAILDIAHSHHLSGWPLATSVAAPSRRRSASVHQPLRHFLCYLQNSQPPKTLSFAFDYIPKWSHEQQDPFQKPLSFLPTIYSTKLQRTTSPSQAPLS
ncbi:hypothetical protein V6N13_020632 [Hibiscus sabdariffa]